MVNLNEEQPQQHQQQDQPQQIQPAHLPQQENARTHRTHKDDIISSLIRKLSLCEKLSMNKEIEEKNKERELQTLKNRIDPIIHPDPGSETASLITIDDVDMDDMKDPSMFSRFFNVLPDSLIQKITRENRRDKEEKEKRKRDDTLSKTTLDECREVKRRCMDGDKAAK